MDEVEERIELALSYRLSKMFNAAVRQQNPKIKRLKKHLRELAVYRVLDGTSSDEIPTHELDRQADVYYRQLIKDIPKLDKRKGERMAKTNTSYMDVVVEPAAHAEDEANYGVFERVSEETVTLTISRRAYSELAAAVEKIALSQGED